MAHKTHHRSLAAFAPSIAWEPNGRPKHADWVTYQWKDKDSWVVIYPKELRTDGVHGHGVEAGEDEAHAQREVDAQPCEGDDPTSRVTLHGTPSLSLDVRRTASPAAVKILCVEQPGRDEVAAGGAG